MSTVQLIIIVVILTSFCFFYLSDAAYKNGQKPKMNGHDTKRMLANENHQDASNTFQGIPFHPQLMALSAASAAHWPSQHDPNAFHKSASGAGNKRQGSSSASEDLAKHQKMMVLKKPEGPVLCE